MRIILAMSQDVELRERADGCVLWRRDNIKCVRTEDDELVVVVEGEDDDDDT